MSVIFRLLWPLIYACSAYAVYRLVRFLVHPWFTRLRYIHGPPSASLYFGNLKQMFDADDDRVLEGWVEKYGNTYKYYGLFNVRCDSLRLLVRFGARHYCLDASDLYDGPEGNKLYPNAFYGVPKTKGVALLSVKASGRRYVTVYWTTSQVNKHITQSGVLVAEGAYEAN